MKKPHHHFSPKKKSFPPQHHAPSVATWVEGTLQLKGNFGFVLSETPEVGDVLVQGPSLRLAMEGDRVRAKVTSSSKAERRSGFIERVVKRAHQTMVGTFSLLNNKPILTTESGNITIHILDKQTLSPRVGDVAVVRITRWPTAKEEAAGVLTEVLGSRDKPGVDLTAIVRHYELPQEFPPAVAAEGASFGSEVPESTWQDPHRELFFDRRVFTIDGADAKDFDDAVSLEPIENGWRLGVHIADVAHYVHAGLFLDQEARRRGTSVYFPGRVLPMLPFPLSDGLCSLRPDCVRLTLSCIMDIDREGRVVHERVVESAIRSAKRFTYEEVENILKGATPTDLDPNIVTDVRHMGELARFLRKKRFERGSLDFDFPEPNVIIDADGRPTDIRRRDRLEAHRLIEDFMLLANETVARFMKDRPFLYRIHETPDPARLEKLKKSLETAGLSLPKHIDPTHPAALQEILSKSEGTSLQPMVHLMILRSLKQAVYSATNKGHYGLASTCYTHFTSPIRRYPDLIVHRLLKERLHNIRRPEYWVEELPVVCDHVSKRERVAVEAEREFLDIQKVRLMEPHVGETFTGVISGVTNFGLFIQLNEYFVEGLVHVTTLGRDYYFFNEASMTLTGRRTGQMFALGMPVKIRLSAAHVSKRQLDFQLLTDDDKPEKKPKHSFPHRRNNSARHPEKKGKRKFK